MNTLLGRILMAVAFACAAMIGATAAWAGPLSQEDMQKIQGIVAAQFAALAQDDADSAFATATPSVQEAIGNSGRFLAMVRGAYPMVYRPATVRFHKAEEDDGVVLQLVEITDDDAKSWLALFALERQTDASWRISGCVVAENRWQST